VRRVSAPIRREMRRRAAVEPVIGHMKAEHRMGRNYLKGRDGDRINAVLAAAGYNFVWGCSVSMTQSIAAFPSVVVVAVRVRGWSPIDRQEIRRRPPADIARQISDQRRNPPVARTCAPQTCMRWTIVVPTMMQPCASAAGFRDGGAILQPGTVAML
jgi:hypothetical protein